MDGQNILAGKDIIKEEENNPADHDKGISEMVRLQKEMENLKIQMDKIQRDVIYLSTKLSLKYANIINSPESQNPSNVPITRTIRTAKITPYFEQKNYNKADLSKEKKEDKIKDGDQNAEKSSFFLFKRKG